MSKKSDSSEKKRCDGIRQKAYSPSHLTSPIFRWCPFNYRLYYKTSDAKIDDKFNALEQRFDSLEKNFDRQNTLIIACIAIPLALITLMIAWRCLKDTSLQKQIDTLSEIIESQKQQLTEGVKS